MQTESLPVGCAVSLTFCDVGENGIGMEKLGHPTSRPVTVAALEAMKRRFEERAGVAELHDLKGALEGAVDASQLRGAPPVPEAAVLVLRGFTDAVLGEGKLAQIEFEAQSMMRRGLVDSKALMRGQVKNKNARHNNVIADHEQPPNIPAGKGTVVKFADYPAIAAMRDAAQEWMQQEMPLVAEQNRYFDVKSCGIGFHGDAERDVVWGLRVGKATVKMPLLFNAWHWHEAIGPMTTICLNPGDVYVMSHAAVGKKWKTPSLVTWRHAAGSASCKYSRMKKPKVAGGGTRGPIHK